MFRRYDIGWKDPSGDHGLIAAHDGGLTPDEEVPLYEWSDLTRAPFRAHWFLVALTEETMALIRVSPIEGGTRGTASYSHAVLFTREDVEWGVDLAEIMDAFPPVPDLIGRPSCWGSGHSLMAPERVLSRDQLSADPSLLAAILDTPLPLKQCEFVEPGGLTQEEQIALALRIYSAIPLRLQSAGLNFATSAAPGFAKPYFGFRPASRRDRTSRALAHFWLSQVGRWAPELLRAADLSNSQSLFRRFAEELASAPGRGTDERVRDLVETLLAVPLRDLDDAKLNGIEEALAHLAPRIKGEFLLALIERLEQHPVPGAHPQWILRLLSDPQAIAELAVPKRQAALQRFFEVLPHELERVIPQFDPDTQKDTLVALHQALRARGFADEQHPTGFGALARAVLSASLLSDDMQPGHGVALFSLRLLREMMQEAALRGGTIVDAAAHVTRQVVTMPHVFAARLLDLAIYLTLQVATSKDGESTATTLRFLVGESFSGSHGELDCFLSALACLDNTRSREDINTVLDAFEIALPANDHLWIPEMRKCLSSAATGRQHVSH